MKKAAESPIGPGSGATRSEVLSWPATVRLWPEAGRAVGLGRAATYELAARGEVPIRVLRLGAKLRVSTADLIRYLGLDETGAAAS